MRDVGKYQLIRKLATGGMAEVYLAKAAGPRGFEKTLVVKCILPHLAEEPSFVEMFLSEAMLAARLTHPHIVQIFDFGEADGAYFLAMEYIDGPSLRTLIKRASAQGQPLSPAVCARLVSQACEGLAFAHDFTDPDTGEAQGLIHRDVSPDNLLLSRQGAVKVVDFGIAKAANQHHKTESGVVKGKLSYMPPEQLRARSVDRRVDVYALGVVLYELLTFHKPHSAPSDAALMHSILFEPPRPAVHYRPDLPVALQRILARAIHKDREQRYPDCNAFQADLEDFILSEGRSVTAQQVAQLVQRTLSSTALPVQKPSPEVAPEPAPSLLAPDPSSTIPGTRTDRTTVPATPRPMDEDTIPEKFTAPAEHPPSTTPPARTGPWRRALPKPGPSAWKRYALVGGVLLVAGAGLVYGKRSASQERFVPPPVNNPEALSSIPTSVTPVATVAQAPSPVAPRAEAVAPPPPAPSPEPSASPPAAVAVGARERAARPAKPRRASPTMGLLDVRAHPFAVVFVDGKPSGQTPWDEPLTLPAGVHTVTLTSPTLSKTVTRRVEVRPEKNTPTLVRVSFLEE